jgi:sugar phosphate isomerase/epimerase
MSLGVAHFSAISLSPTDLVEAAAGAGFSRVGLRLFPAFAGAPCYALPQGSPAAIDFAGRLDATGLSLFDIEFVVIDEGFDPRATRRVLEDAAALGAKRLSCCGADVDRGRLTDNLTALCEVAAEVGMAVDLENMGWRAVRSFADSARVIRATGASNCGVLVDALHFLRNGGTPDQLAQNADLVHAFQLCDATGLAPQTDTARIAEARSGRVSPGRGSFDLPALLRALPMHTAVSVEVPNAEGAPAGPHLTQLYADAIHLINTGISTSCPGPMS